MRKRYITLIVAVIVALAGIVAGPGLPTAAPERTAKDDIADRLNPTRSSGDVKGAQTGNDETAGDDRPIGQPAPVPLPTTPPTPGVETYRVASVSDGDTIRIEIGGAKRTVRLIGVDTPETSRPNTPVQCYGRQATAYARTLIGNGPVRLATDAHTDDKDRYGRLLRYVYLQDGRLVQHELIRSGHGFAYTLFPFTLSEEFTGLQQEAQAAKLGLWHECAPTRQENGAYTTGV